MAVILLHRWLLLSVCVLLPVTGVFKHSRPNLQKKESLNYDRVDDLLVETTHMRLWLGEDLNEEDLKVLVSNPPSLRLNSTSIVLDERKIAPIIKVVGMFGSGTNLMEEYLHQNNLDLMADHSNDSRLFSRRRKVEDDTSRKSLTSDAFWKHTHPYRILDFSSDHPVVVVAMVRNPFTQLLSWRREPFNLHTCLRNPYDACVCEDHCDGIYCTDEPLGFPCGDVSDDNLDGQLYNFGEDLPEGIQRLADSASVSYPNVLGVWNRYAQGYEQLSNDKFPVKAFVVRYEDLVLSPEKTLERLAEWLQIPNFSTGATVDENSRKFDKHGSARDEAIHKIKTQSHHDVFDSAEIAQICDSLDRKLLDELMYSDECESTSSSNGSSSSGT